MADDSLVAKLAQPFLLFRSSRFSMVGPFLCIEGSTVAFLFKNLFDDSERRTSNESIGGGYNFEEGSDTDRKQGELQSTHTRLK